LSQQENAMNGKPLAILATAVLICSVSPVHAADGINRPAGANAKADAADDGALNAQVAPTDLSAAKKKKGKGGTKGGEPYMTIKMQDTMVTSYRPAQGGRPKGPSGGLLGYSGGNFGPNPPSPTGTPVAPPANPGGGVIR
jgi:hypothetical protein